jgi:amino acid adenylation domain-containing protein
VLARYSGREDVVVGSPVAGRQRSELESLIGFFLNTLVMRSDLSGNPDVRILLARVRETALGAYQHQDLPFEKLLEALQPARSLSTPPLVQVMFNLHNEFDQPLQLSDDSYTFHIDRGAAKFDLNLAVAEGDAGLLLALEYSTDLFDAATMDQMLKVFESVLVEMTQSQSRRLSEFSWRVDTQSVSMPASQPLAAATTVVELFDRQLSDYAARPAVQVGDRVWTYAELAARANQVAADVLAVAAGLPVQQVGLLLGHDAVMLAGLLGTLKAGKAYVPLDPESPPERLQSIIASAGITLIVSAAEHIELASALAGNLPVLAVSDEPVSDPGSPELQPGADELAYILFTSGTTGIPKGVMQTHANVLHHAATYRNALGIGSSDRLSLLSPFGFDAAVMDIYASLISGACLCPFDVKHEAYLGEVIEAIAASNITVLHSTPTVYRYLMRHKICRYDVTEVRAVVLGGEAAKTGDFEFFKSNFKPHTVFVNGLGPSECSLALQWFAGQQTELHGGLVPVGKPVAGVEVILLDTHQQESGICGELAIACTHVTAGYWQQPELTSKAFVEMNGKRWYRSGDRARYLPDGNLVFTGRIDEQIKLRGHRIEPGEIEAQLTSHERADRAVVALRDDLQGNPRLVAWVVPKKRQALETSELRDFLKAHLPRYMMPSVIMVLDNLPLTSNGKIDRRALPIPKWGRNEEQSYVAPRNELEQKLAAIWSDVLGVEKIGVDDDFFELGGHSLLAMQLMARTTESLQIGLPLRRLFDGPTIAQVAKSIDDVRWALGSADS